MGGDLENHQNPKQQARLRQKGHSCKANKISHIHGIAGEPVNTICVKTFSVGKTVSCDGSRTYEKTGQIEKNTQEKTTGNADLHIKKKQIEKQEVGGQAVLGRQ